MGHFGGIGLTLSLWLTFVPLGDCNVPRVPRVPPYCPTVCLRVTCASPRGVTESPQMSQGSPPRASRDTGDKPRSSASG